MAVYAVGMAVETVCNRYDEGFEYVPVSERILVNGLMLIFLCLIAFWVFLPLSFLTDWIQSGKKGWKRAVAMGGSLLIHWMLAFFLLWILLWLYNNTAVLLLLFPTFFVVYETIKASGRYKGIALSLGGVAILSLLTYSGFLGYMETKESPELEPMISDGALEKAELALETYHLLESYRVEVNHDQNKIKVEITTTRKIPLSEAVQVGETYAQVLADDFGDSGEIGPEGSLDHAAELWNHWDLEIMVGPGFFCDHRGEKKRGQAFRWQGPLMCPG